MAGKPAEPGACGSSGRDASPPQPELTASDSATASPPERLGPLALTRMVKPDGRALIVYARVDAPGGPPS
jgi:hypothetical protein